MPVAHTSARAPGSGRGRRVGLVAAVAAEALAAGFAALWLGLFLVPEAMGVETFAVLCDATPAAESYLWWGVVVGFLAWLALVAALVAAREWDEPRRVLFLLLLPPAFVVAVVVVALVVSALIGPQPCEPGDISF